MNISDIKLEEIYDVSILRHGFTQYVRDYEFEIETNWINDLAGRYILTFKHCYEMDYKTLVKDEIIKKSWDDLFTDYETWQKESEPDGFVWGTNWSLAYPGFQPLTKSEKADKWSLRLTKQMKEVKLESNSFEINLVYENWNLKRLNDDKSLISQVMIPLDE